MKPTIDEWNALGVVVCLSALMLFGLGCLLDEVIRQTWLPAPQAGYTSLGEEN